MTTSFEIVIGGLAGALVGLLVMYVLRKITERIGRADVRFGRLVLMASVLRVSSLAVGGVLMLVWGAPPGIAYFVGWLVARTVYVERFRRNS